MSTTQTFKLCLRFLVKENQDENPEDYKQEHRLSVANVLECLPLINNFIATFIWDTKKEGLQITVKEISLFQKVNLPDRSNPQVFHWLMNNKAMPVYTAEQLQTYFDFCTLKTKIYK